MIRSNLNGEQKNNQDHDPKLSLKDSVTESQKNTNIDSDSISLNSSKLSILGTRDYFDIYRSFS